MKLITGIQNGKPVDLNQFFENCKFFEGKKVDIDMRKHDEKRTVDQNDGIWRWDTLLAEFAGYSPSEMHYLMCGEIFGWNEYNIEGQEFRVPKRTTRNLNKFSEWQNYILNYRIKAREIFDYEMPNFGWND